MTNDLCNNVEDFFKWHGEILNKTNKFKVVKQVGNLRNELIHQLEPVKEEPNKLKEKMVGMDGFVRTAYIITYINQAIERKYDDKEIKKYIIVIDRLKVELENQFHLPMEKH